MDVNIRKRFGCTVAEIDRQGFIIATPGPQDRLFPGDRLLLLGDEVGLRAARKELDRETEGGEEDFDDVRLHMVEIEATLPKAGRSLAEWQTGERWPAIVVGIERDGRRITQPEAREVIGVGDRLLLLGTPAQVRTFLRVDEAGGSD
jgi:CPA2 family monovalent cation:H+ antiporter-2